MVEFSSKKINIVKYPTLVGAVVTVAINAIILYYILGLEKAHCDCTRDPQHDFLKYLTMFNIAWPLVATVLITLLNYVLKTNVVKVLWYLVMASYTFVLLYGSIILWRYVDLLNREDCKCAENDMQNINTFLNIWRWIQLVFSALGAIGILLIGIKLLRA